MIEPGTYECWRVASITVPDSSGSRRSQSDPILDRDTALELAEKAKAAIDNRHGPYYSRPWIWTSRSDEIARVLPYGRMQERRHQYLLDAGEIAWSSGPQDVVAVFRDHFTVR